MWKPHLNFITLHYAWIILCGLLGLVVLTPEGNIAAIDAYFFGASASTESGLNTVDVKALRTYQQVFLYIIPTITNLGFVNIMVVVARIFWFRKKLNASAQSNPRPTPKGVVFSLRRDEDLEGHKRTPDDPSAVNEAKRVTSDGEVVSSADPSGPTSSDSDYKRPKSSSTEYYIPPPLERDNGQPFIEKRLRETEPADEGQDEVKPSRTTGETASMLKQRKYVGNEGPAISAAKSIENAAGSMFVLGSRPSAERRLSSTSQHPRPNNLPGLSKQVTIGRNSQFHDLTAEDAETLGGIEYTALKLLLKIVCGYYLGLHFLGVISLLPWIHTAPSKYTDWLAECGQDKTWWAFYSSQTMINNLGFTLTPDSMITFKDATWPMLLMTFLAFAGNTCYPVVLRFCIWVTYKLTPSNKPTKAALKFLLDHPRRCYTLLFPSHPTWILFGIIAALNFVDVLLIVVLDLDNPAVNDLPMGPRILSALFQAASSRHTGTSTLNLAEINPAVQFSLLVMMYIAILPIAISIRQCHPYLFPPPPPPSTCGRMVRDERARLDASTIGMTQTVRSWLRGGYIKSTDKLLEEVKAPGADLLAELSFAEAREATGGRITCTVPL
ncbi:cation transport protein-domain-containing protein [Diaporthe sp. PMI_573]|nr:cation transport protein-domain-containing protein [Diaporthaceae sp. PMI_573]